jgi:uncharacterized protein YllA (UPF0747 family)
MMNQQPDTTLSGRNELETAPEIGSKLDLKNLNWPTVILILITGGGNFLATQNNSGQRQYQIDRAIEQIRELHDALDDQRQMVETSQDIAKTNQDILTRFASGRELIQNQERMTKLLEGIVKELATQQKLLEGIERRPGTHQLMLENQNKMLGGQNFKNPSYPQ